MRRRGGVVIEERSRRRDVQALVWSNATFRPFSQTSSPQDRLANRIGPGPDLPAGRFLLCPGRLSGPGCRRHSVRGFPFAGRRGHPDRHSDRYSDRYPDRYADRHPDRHAHPDRYSDAHAYSYSYSDSNGGARTHLGATQGRL